MRTYWYRCASCTTDRSPSFATCRCGVGTLMTKLLRRVPGDKAAAPRKVRAAYPALADGYAYLDGAAGTQVPEAVIGAIADVYRAGIGNAGGAFPASQRADEIIARCRLAVADMTGGVPEGVILGPNMTTLTYRLAYTLARTWGQGDEVIVSRLDHDANVRPWIQAA